MACVWRMLATIGLGLLLIGCEPEEKVDENSAAFEASLQGKGLEPLGPADAAALLRDATLYGRYGGAKERWIEYYSGTGVTVFQPYADQSPRRRLVYFGTWWGEEDRTCFSYPEGKLDCYRLYADEAGIYFIRLEGGTTDPPGSLAVVADEIRPGNAEKYPFVAD